MANWQKQRLLILIAGLSGLIYLLIFTWPFLLFRFYDTIPPVDYAKLTHYSPAGLIAYVIGLGVLFGFYVWSIRLAAPSELAEQSSSPETISPRPIFFAGAISASLLIFSYPLTAIDLFVYAIRTRGWALYGLNPLVTTPKALPAGDPWLGLAAEWVDAPSPYGPLWEGISLVGFYLGGGNFLGHLFALKIIAFVAYLGCAWLIYKIVRQLQPKWAVAGVIGFAWNPLTLLESIQNGHNDIVMVFFMLAAIWALVKTLSRQKEETKAPINFLLRLDVCLFLALSILVKFVTMIIAPFFLWELVKDQPGWSRRLGALIGFGFIVAGVVILPLFLLWPGWDRWAVVEASNHAGRSLLALLILALKTSFGLNFAFDLAHILTITIFALIYLYCLWLVISSRIRKSVIGDQLPANNRQKSPIYPFYASRFAPPRLLLTASFLAFFWYVLLTAPVFHAWYLLWFLPLAVLLLPDPLPLKATIVFSITALLVIPYFEIIRVWYPALLQNQLLGHLIGVSLLIIPPALVLIRPISPSVKSKVR